jgi:hypothetical protein
VGLHVFLSSSLYILFILLLVKAASFVTRTSQITNFSPLVVAYWKIPRGKLLEINFLVLSLGMSGLYSRASYSTLSPMNITSAIKMNSKFRQHCMFHTIYRWNHSFVLLVYYISSRSSHFSIVLRPVFGL